MDEPARPGRLPSSVTAVEARTVVVAILALVVGVAGWRWLATGGYRREDEGGPLPRHVWVAAVAPFVAVAVERGLADRPWPVLLAPLSLSLAGLVLAAIDADVHRLPNAITVPLAPVIALAVTVASFATGDLAALARAGTAALLVGGGAIALSLLLPGRSIGLGDAKLLVSIAPTLAWLGWSELVVGIWLGFVLGGIVALSLLLTRRAGRRTSLAFGPHLVAGAVLALALA